ncbi:MAG: polysaccharide biosynthesis/export family protein [Myxococcota bacterium]
MRGLLVVLALATGCSSSHAYVWATDLPLTDPTPRLRERDTVTVQVRGQENLSGDFLVRADGTLLLPVVGSIPALGQTPAEVQATLTKRLRGIVVRPEVTVSVSETRTLNVNVIGEVNNPGVYPISGSDNLLAVLAQAGGLTEFASRSSIFVVRLGDDNNRVRFRYSDLIGGESKSLAYRLQAGDSVVVE